MARNFRILPAEKSNRLVRLQLQGDFDGTSAYLLINTLHKYLASYPKVAIDTEGLRQINSFGLDVFSNLIKLLRKPHTRIVFSGRHRCNFIQD